MSSFEFPNMTSCPKVPIYFISDEKNHENGCLISIETPSHYSSYVPQICCTRDEVHSLVLNENLFYMNLRVSIGQHIKF